jgi:hypothetical protein
LAFRYRKRLAAHDFDLTVNRWIRAAKTAAVAEPPPRKKHLTDFQFGGDTIRAWLNRRYN